MMPTPRRTMKQSKFQKVLNKKVLNTPEQYTSGIKYRGITFIYIQMYISYDM